MKIMIFHHNDNDGRAAAAMMYLYLVNKLNDNTSIEFTEIDYNKNLPIIERDIYSQVYILDYSFTPATLYLLKDIKNNLKENGTITWIDHHKSSLEVYNEAKTICNAGVLLVMEKSGARLVYEIFVANKAFDDPGIYRTIQLVDDYDRWVHNFPESMLFNNGSMLFNTHPTSDIWLKDPKKVVETGKVIKEYRDLTNTRLANNNAYEVIINDHKCIVMNTLEASSQVFGDLYDKYKFGIRFGFDGYKYTYSIYSQLEDIDCSLIVKMINTSGEK